MADNVQVINISEEDIVLGQRIISAASRHDLTALRILLKEGSANVRDPDNGTTPLHAAIASCKLEQNGSATVSVSEEAAAKVVEYLLANGAIWNDLNKENETPGCVALRLHLTKLYEIMVDAGVRAELLFAKLEELESPAGGNEVVEDTTPDSPEYDVSQDNHSYLKSSLRFQPGILLDSSDNAVMMSWENTIMTRHAETLLPTPGLRALNVGHGMGIVDTAIQAREPSQHHIIEAHPEVLAKLRENGWYDKANVTIHEGRWQDVLPKLIEHGVVFDAIFYDTFAEAYFALKNFFSEHVPSILDSNGRLGWYNGLGADRQICYDVYTKIAEWDLLDAGFDTSWEEIGVPDEVHSSSLWDLTRRPYWRIDVYRLPVNTFIK